MHDALRVAYEPDTIVEEPSLGRVSTEDLLMQTNVLGVWHRRLPDLSATSCGMPFNSQFSPVRREELRHPLCPDCFTAFELRKADERKEKEIAP